MPGLWSARPDMSMRLGWTAASEMDEGAPELGPQGLNGLFDRHERGAAV